MCEGELETEHNCNIYWPPLLWPSALCFSRSPDAQPKARGPSSLLSAGLLYHIISNSSNLQLLISCFHRAIQQFNCPLNRPLNLWNGMPDRHQAEITVMQPRSHSLPAHQSMRVSWAFTLSHFVSHIRQRDLFRLLAIGMCHFLPVHHFGMACPAGPKVYIYNINPNAYGWGCAEIIFWMMEVYVDGTIFALTVGSGLMTWPELTLFFDVEAGNRKLGLFGEDFGGNGTLKKELCAWPPRIMWCEEIFLWIGKFLMADWETDGVLSGILYLLLNLQVERRYL